MAIQPADFHPSIDPCMGVIDRPKCPDKVTRGQEMLGV